MTTPFDREPLKLPLGGVAIRQFSLAATLLFLLLSLIVLAGVTYADWATGEALDVSILYFIPIVVITITSGMRWGLFMAMVAGVGVHIADMLLPVPHTYLNDALHLAVFLFIAVITGRLVEAYSALRHYHEALQRAHDRINADLASAREIQLRLLPERIPELPGFEIGATISFAETVGGDFYAFLPTGRRLGICVADISGKSVRAALFSWVLKVLMERAEGFAGEPERVLRYLDSELREHAVEEMFVTMMYAVVDPDTGRVLLAGAGHEPPILHQRAAEAARPVEIRGAILGLIPGGDDRSVVQVDLRPGDALLLYTDGATELSTGGTERVGTEGLCRLVATHGDKPATEMVERILADLLAMAGGPTRDDITLLAIKRKL